MFSYFVFDVSLSCCAAHTIVFVKLSPLDSFASELGTRFPVRLEARHVVDLQRQVMAATIGVGPTRVSLAATFASAATTNWQDEV